MLQNGLRGMTAAVVIGMLLAGCGQTKIPPQSAGPEPAKTTQAAGTGVDKPAATPAQSQSTKNGDTQNKQAKVKVYYSDADFMKLVEKEATISYKQDADKYKATLQAQAGNGDDKSLPLFKGFTFKSAVLKDGLLTVDLSMTPEARLGSGGEEMIINALQKSLFQFTEVQAIDILVDGKQVESLMGHMDLPHPFKRSNK